MEDRGEKRSQRKKREGGGREETENKGGLQKMGIMLEEKDASREVKKRASHSGKR